MIMKFFDSLPQGLLLGIGIILVGLVGVVDYLTGDYSVLIFYSVPVFLVSWCAGRWPGIGISVAASCVRFFTNLPDNDYAMVDLWNSSQDLLFFVIISLLVHYLRRALE